MHYFIYRYGLILAPYMLVLFILINTFTLFFYTVVSSGYENKIFHLIKSFNKMFSTNYNGWEMSYFFITITLFPMILIFALLVNSYLNLTDDEIKKAKPNSMRVVYKLLFFWAAISIGFLIFLRFGTFNFPSDFMQQLIQYVDY